MNSITFYTCTSSVLDLNFGGSMVKVLRPSNSCWWTRVSLLQTHRSVLMALSSDQRAFSRAISSHQLFHAVSMLLREWSTCCTDLQVEVLVPSDVLPNIDHTLEYYTSCIPLEHLLDPHLLQLCGGACLTCVSVSCSFANQLGVALTEEGGVVHMFKNGVN